MYSNLASGEAEFVLSQTSPEPMEVKEIESTSPAVLADVPVIKTSKTVKKNKKTFSRRQHVLKYQEVAAEKHAHAINVSSLIEPITTVLESSPSIASQVDVIAAHTTAATNESVVTSLSVCVDGISLSGPGINKSFPLLKELPIGVKQTPRQVFSHSYSLFGNTNSQQRSPMEDWVKIIKTMHFEMSGTPRR